MNKRYMVLVLCGMLSSSLLLGQVEEKTMLHKVSDSVAWVADSRVVNFIAKVGGLACATVLFAKLLRMASYYYTFGNFYDANDDKYIGRVEFGDLEQRVSYAHARINGLEGR